MKEDDDVDDGYAGEDGATAVFLSPKKHKRRKGKRKKKCLLFSLCSTDWLKIGFLSGFSGLAIPADGSTWSVPV